MVRYQHNDFFGEMRFVGEFFSQLFSGVVERASALFRHLEYQTGVGPLWMPLLTTFGASLALIATGTLGPVGFFFFNLCTPFCAHFTAMTFGFNVEFWKVFLFGRPMSLESWIRVRHYLTSALIPILVAAYYIRSRPVIGSPVDEAGKDRPSHGKRRTAVRRLKKYKFKSGALERLYKEEWEQYKDDLYTDRQYLEDQLREIADSILDADDDKGGIEALFSADAHWRENEFVMFSTALSALKGATNDPNRRRQATLALLGRLATVGADVEQKTWGRLNGDESKSRRVNPPGPVEEKEEKKVSSPSSAGSIAGFNPLINATRPPQVGLEIISDAIRANVGGAPVEFPTVVFHSPKPVEPAAPVAVSTVVAEAQAPSQVDSARSAPPGIPDEDEKKTEVAPEKKKRRRHRKKKDAAEEKTSAPRVVNHSGGRVGSRGLKKISHLMLLAQDWQDFRNLLAFARALEHFSTFLNVLWWGWLAERCFAVNLRPPADSTAWYEWFVVTATSCVLKAGWWYFNIGDAVRLLVESLVFRRAVEKLLPLVGEALDWVMKGAPDSLDEALDSFDDQSTTVIGLALLAVGDMLGVDAVSSFGLLRSIFETDSSKRAFAAQPKHYRAAILALLAVGAAVRAWNLGRKLAPAGVKSRYERSQFTQSIGFVAGPVLQPYELCGVCNSRHAGTCAASDGGAADDRKHSSPDSMVVLEDEALVFEKPKIDIVDFAKFTPQGCGIMFRIRDALYTASHVLESEDLESTLVVEPDVARLKLSPKDLPALRLAPVAQKPPTFGMMAVARGKDAERKLVSVPWQLTPDFSMSEEGVCYYECATEKGDSGAPVCDAQGRLVGVHLGSIEVTDSAHRTRRVNRFQFLSGNTEFVESLKVVQHSLPGRLAKISEHYAGIDPRMAFVAAGRSVVVGWSDSPGLWSIPKLPQFSQTEYVIPPVNLITDSINFFRKYGAAASASRDKVDRRPSYRQGWAAVLAVCATLLALNGSQKFRLSSPETAHEVLSDRDSSKGFPIKKAYGFVDEIPSDELSRLGEGVRQFYLANGYTPSLMQLFTKQELTKTSKVADGDVRKICNVPRDLQYWFVRAGFEWHQCHQRCHLFGGPWMVGLNVDSAEWQYVFERHNAYDTHWVVDLKGAEFSFTSQDLQWLFSVRRELSDESVWPILDMLEDAMLEKIVVSTRGEAEFCPALNPSGVYDTTVNTDLHVLRMFFSYLASALGEVPSNWRSLLALSMYGDNMLISPAAVLVEAGLSPEGFASYLAETGVKIKFSAHDSLEDAEFLSQKFVPYYGRVMRTTHNRTKLLASLTVTRCGRQVQPEKHSQKLVAIWHQFVFGDAEDYEYVQRVIVAFLDLYGKVQPTPYWVPQLGECLVSQPAARVRLAQLHAGPRLSDNDQQKKKREKKMPRKSKAKKLAALAAKNVERALVLAKPKPKPKPKKMLVPAPRAVRPVSKGPLGSKMASNLQMQARPGPSSVKTISELSALSCVDPFKAYELQVPAVLPDGDMSPSSSQWTMTRKIYTSISDGATSHFVLVYCTRSPAACLFSGSAYSALNGGTCTALTSANCTGYATFTPNFYTVRAAAQGIRCALVTGPFNWAGGTVLAGTATVGDMNSGSISYDGLLNATACSENAISTPGDIITMNVLPSEQTSGGEFEWRTPSTGAVAPDQVAYIFFKSSAPFQVAVEVAQCWQCHPFAASGTIFNPVPTYCADTDYDPVILKSYQRVPQRDPRRVRRSPEGPPDEWQQDLANALRRGLESGIHRASRWASETAVSFFGPASAPQTMSEYEWASRHIEAPGSIFVETLFEAFSEGVKPDGLKTWLKRHERHATGRCLRITAVGPVVVNAGPLTDEDDEKDSFAPVPSPVASKAGGQRSASLGARLRG